MKSWAWVFIAIQITCYNVGNTVKLNNCTILYKGYRIILTTFQEIQYVRQTCTYDYDCYKVKSLKA